MRGTVVYVSKRFHLNIFNPMTISWSALLATIREFCISNIFVRARMSSFWCFTCCRGLPSDWRKIPLAEFVGRLPWPGRATILVRIETTRRRSQGTSLNWRRQSGGPWRRETRRWRDETGWNEMGRAAERKREKGGRERESGGNKTWKNKTGRTTLMRATGWPTQGSLFPGSSWPLVEADNFRPAAGLLRRRRRQPPVRPPPRHGTPPRSTFLASSLSTLWLRNGNLDLCILPRQPLISICFLSLSREFF